MLNKLDDALSFHQNALRVRGQRQELIAANIANADTPHFKARDIDFKDALGAALAGRRSGDVGMMATSPRHLGGAAGPSFAGAIKYRTEFQPSIDGNTVNMDVERSAFAANALRLEAAMAFISGAFKSLQLAMSQ